MTAQEHQSRKGEAPQDRHDFDDVPSEPPAGPHGAAANPLEEELASLIAQRDESLAKYQRALADFQNFQRRSIQNEQQARRRGQSEIVRDLIPSLEHLDLALAQEPQSESDRKVIEGISMVRDEILKALASHGAARIVVNPGDEFDPHQHEAMLHIEAKGVSPNHIAQMLQVGYIMGDVVLKPAKVALAK